jgi:hypothetical protein
MGADQCGVPGCDWRRSNTNPRCNSNSNAFSHACGDTNSNTNSHRHAKAHSFTKASSDTGAKTLIRYRGNRQGATKVSSEASTSFAIDRYVKKSLNRSSCTMEA